MTHQASVAYAEPRAAAAVWFAGDGLMPDDEAMPAKGARQAAFQVDPGVLQLAAVLPGTERFSLKPPAPSATVGDVDERTAEAALRDVLAALRSADAACEKLRADAPEDDTAATALQPTIRTLGEITASLMDFYGAAISMETLQLRLFDVLSSGTLDLMALSCSNQTMLRDVEAALARRKIEAENRAREEQAKLNEKAGKGGVFSLVCNWAMAAAQVITGCVKLLTGQPQGVLDIATAVAGITKCVLMTVVHCHPELREKLQDDIERCAKAEFVLGTASGAASLFSAARAVQAGRFVVKSAVALGRGEGKALGVTLSRAINTAEEAANAAKGAATEAAAKIAMRESESAMAAAQQIATALGKEIARNSVTRMQEAVRGAFAACSPKLANAVTKMFGEEAIEKIVSDSLMRAAKTVASKRYGDAVNLIETEFANQVEREVMRALARAAVSQQSLLRLATTVVAVGATVTAPVVDGAMRIDFAGKQREINELLRDAILWNFLIESARRSAKQEEEFRENLMDDLQALTMNTTKGIREAAECMQQVVGNMA